MQSSYIPFLKEERGIRKGDFATLVGAANMEEVFLTVYIVEKKFREQIRTFGNKDKMKFCVVKISLFWEFL